MVTSPLMFTQSQPRNAAAQHQIATESIRILHIVENLDNQAVESWLLRVLGASVYDYPHFRWTFFCVLGKEGRLDDMARALGAEVIHSQYEIGDKVRFLRGLRKVMKEGNYDILHCHHDVMSAAYLAASVGLPFQKRIVHVHNTSLNLPTSSRTKAGLMREPMRRICLALADQIVGISKDALESLARENTEDTRGKRIVHYAVDTRSFAEAAIDPDGLRQSLGLKQLSRVILFVGRMVEYKNPRLVLEILVHLARTNPDAVAVFAGSGNEEQKVRDIAERNGLADRVRILGFRSDVPWLMVNSDMLIWPSLEEPKEGLGLGIVEAQAAGLPILMSRSVPKEAIVVPQLVRVLPLAAGARLWAEAVAEILQQELPSQQESLAKVQASSFSMIEGVAEIMALYKL